jgi:hypothetical protein
MRVTQGCWLGLMSGAPGACLGSGRGIGFWVAGRLSRALRLMPQGKGGLAYTYLAIAQACCAEPA